MKLKNVLMGAVLLAVPCGMQAQVTVKRIYKTPNARIANVIWAGDTLYLSGMGSGPKTPADPAKGTPAVWGNTEEQCTGAFTAIQVALKEQGLDMGDIVEMQIFLAADPANGNKIDVPAMNRAYAKFFGTPEQPNRPVRMAGMQLVQLGSATSLVEIMTIAVKSKK
jgi:enamine deaminase RidA (YjgF/YER057c/UK114 family)